MKRSVAGLVLVLVTVGVFAGSASTASALRCAVAVEKGTAIYSDNKCTNKAGMLQFITVVTGGTWTADGFECAVVVEPGTAVYSDSACTNKTGTLQYVKVTRYPRNFNCSTEPCRYTLKADGTGKTAHHVIVVSNSAAESASITCNQLTGEATAGAKVVTELTFTSLAYDVCTVNGLEAKAKANGCDYLLGGDGSLTIQGCAGGKIEFEIAATGCVFSIGAQGPLFGVNYHNIGEKEKTTAEVTIETKVAGLAAGVSGSKEKCGIDPSKTPITAEYTTGNSIATAETDPGGVMANAWWE